MVLMMFSFQMQNIIAENLTTQKTSTLESNRYRKNVDNVLSGVHENAFILLIFMTSKRKKSFKPRTSTLFPSHSRKIFQFTEICLIL